MESILTYRRLSWVSHVCNCISLFPQKNIVLVTGLALEWKNLVNTHHCLWVHNVLQDCLILMNSVFLMAFCTSLEGQTTINLTVYATSAFAEHSLVATVYVVQGVVNGRSYKIRDTTISFSDPT